MKNLSTLDVQGTLNKIGKIEQLEDKLDSIVSENKEANKVLREEIMKCLAELREEIIAVDQKFDREQQALKQRRVKAIRLFESE